MTEENYYCLDIIEGPDRGRSFPLTKDTIIVGRSKQCDIIMTDETISRQHFQLSLVHKGTDLFELTDLNSRNGVFLNNNKIETANLSLADRILIGDSLLILREVKKSEFDAFMSPDARLGIQEKDTEDKLVASIGVEDVHFSDLSLDHVENVTIKKRLKTLYKISEIISRQESLSEKLLMLLDTIFEVIPAETGFIAIKNKSTGTLEPFVIKPEVVSQDQRHLKVSWTIIKKCIDDRIGILASDATQDERFDLAESIFREKLRSVLSVPLFFHNTLFGVIFLSTTVIEGSFTESDLEFITGIANEIAMVIERDQSLQALIAREKMAEVGELVAGLSHYIRNIIFAFQESQTLIDRALDKGDDEIVKMTWPIIKNSAGRISDLVNDMLYFSKERKSIKKMIDVHTIINDIVTLYKPIFDKNQIKLKLSLQDQLPHCKLDSQSFYRVILNLIKNAIDAVTEKKPALIRIETAFFPDEEIVRIEISDNGTGIASQNLEKIFHYLFSTKGNQGTGIGLYVSKQIVEDHNGTLTVTSELDEGSTFIISLPVSTSSSED